MSIRQLVIEAYLYVLAFALLAMGFISFAGYLGLENPTVHTVVLLPDSAIVSMLLGGLLLSAVRRVMRPFSLFAALIAGCTLYTLIHNQMVGSSDVGRSLLTGFIRMRSGLAAAILISVIAIFLSLGSTRAKRIAQVLGLVTSLLALAAYFSWKIPSLGPLSLGFKFSSTHIANLFTFLLGIAIILLSLQVPHPDERIKRMPLMAGALGVLLTCGGWYLLSLQTIDTLTRQSDLLLSNVQAATESALQNRLDLMKRLAERWEVLGNLPSEAFWQQEASSYLRDFPNLHLIGVLDEHFQPFWIKGRDDDQATWLRDFLSRRSDLEWLSYVMNDGSPHISRPIERPDYAQTNVMLAVSLRIPAQAPRVLIAMLNIQGELREQFDQLGGFTVKVYEGNTQLYASKSQGQQRFNTPVGEHFISFHHDQSWRLVSYIDDAAAIDTSRVLPALIMLFGLILSFFLMLSQRLAGLAVAHSEYLERVNEELQRSLAGQLKAQALNQRIQQFTQDVLCSFDREGRFREVSPSCVKLFGYSQEELIGRPYLDLVLAEDRGLTEQEAAAVVAGRPTYSFRNRCCDKNGRVLHVLWSADWSEDEQTLFAVAHDITELVRNEADTESQRDILSMIAMEHPQLETLEAICHMVEAQDMGALCSVLLLDAAGKQLHTGAAPSLPAEYSRAIDGAAIGPNVGSCGTAAYRRELVVVEDIELDPLWDDYRHLASPFGLRACWSFPLISHHGQVLGTFALYQKAPHTPTDEQIKRLSMAARLAAIAIARSLDRQRLQESEQRFRSLFTFNPDPVYAFDPNGQFISMNEAGLRLTGLNTDQVLGRHFSQVIVADDLARTQQHFTLACEGIPQRYEVRALDTAGTQLHLDVSNLPIMVDGEIVGVFGIAKDITERVRTAADLHRALARSERQAEQLRAIGAAAIATAKLHGREALINYLVEQVRKVVGAHQAVISLTEEAGCRNSIDAVALSEKYAAWRDYSGSPDHSGIYASIFETNQPLMLTQEKLERHPRWRGFGDHAGKHPPMRGWLAVPLLDKSGANLGLLQLSDKMDGEFDADDLTIAQQFAQMALSVLEKNRLLSEVMAAEQRLKAQLDFTSTVTDCLAEGLIATDEFGVLTFANPAARNFLSVDQDPLGLVLKQLLPLDPRNWKAEAETTIQGEFDVPMQSIHYDARPLNGLAGVRGWVVALRDVSSQRRANQAMRERDQFFNLSLEIFCMVSLQGYFIQVNPAFASILHYSVDSLVGQPYIELIDVADRDRVMEAIQLLENGELIHDLTIRVWDGEGHLHWLQFSAALGEDRVIYCVARDITEKKAIEEQIAQRNLILSMAGNTAKLGGWSIELPGRQVLWSDEMFGLLGFEPGHVPTLDEGLALYTSLHRAAVRSALEACISEGQSFDIDVEIQNANGQLLDARVAGQAVRDESGQIVRVSGALQDVSERKRAQREVLRLAIRLTNTLESITDGFFTVDTQWRFTYVNQEATKQLNLSVHEMLGEEIWTMFPGARDSEIGVRYFQAMEDQQAAHFESFYAPMGRWFEIHAYPSEEGLAVYFRDITVRRRTEEDLQLTMLELERSNRELQEFAFVASHDLQEPLRKIQAFSDRLALRATSLDDVGRDYLQRMTSAASRMQALIIDLLSYSRVNSRGQSLQLVELDQVLDEVLVDMEADIEGTASRIERQPLPIIMGDISQLRQVIQNLLSNAIKFQAAGNTPIIRIYAESVPDGRWSLCIADNGIGFDEKYLDRIFNPFQRLHSRETYSGTGIGLAIVKKIIERHKASITASSIPGQGSVFRITFPRIKKDSP